MCGACHDTKAILIKRFNQHIDQCQLFVVLARSDARPVDAMKPGGGEIGVHTLWENRSCEIAQCVSRPLFVSPSRPRQFYPTWTKMIQVIFLALFSKFAVGFHVPYSPMSKSHPSQVFNAPSLLPWLSGIRLY